MPWTELREGIWKNEDTGAYVLDGRALGCPNCLGGRYDSKSIHRTLNVKRVVDYGPDTTFGTAKALSDFSKNPGEVVIFWKDGEVIDLATFQYSTHQQN